MEEEKTREDHLKAVWFAAGTASFIACIERAVVVSLFAHWRVWAFLALNLLLLAILFTSKSQILSNETNPDDIDADFESKKKKKRAQERKPLVSSNELVVECVTVPEIENEPEKEIKIEGDDGKKEEVEDQIATEELNKKVEAFITMFRQHLVSDAKGNTYRMHQVNSPRRASFSHSNYKYISV